MTMTLDAKTYYAVFKGDKQITKGHSTSLAAATEAMEAGLMVVGSGDFIGERPVTVRLAEGYSVREVRNPPA